MQQEATDRYKNDTLSQTQIAAIESLVSGGTVTKAAEAAGVDRSTVHRWVRSDWVFQANLNRARREIRSALQHRIEKAAERASEIVLSSIEAGDVRTALVLLRGTGMLSGHARMIGPDDPGALQESFEVAERNHQLSKQEAEFSRRLREIRAT